MLKLYWQRFRANKLTRWGAAIIGVLAFAAVVGPWIAPHDPYEQHLLERLRPPSAEFWFGTDELGRDVFSRMLVGVRISLLIGFMAAAISIALGTVAGLIAGYWRGWVDAVLMRWVDIQLCFPTLFLILMILAVFDRPSIYLIVGVIAFTSWAGLARMVRGEVLSVRERDYVLVAKGLGLSSPRILLVHVLPNVITPVIVAATLTVGSAILLESGLSFLGLGVQPPRPS